MIFTLLTTFFVLLSFAVFTAIRGKRYLHIFQQEEYDTVRFRHWLFSSRAYDKRLSMIVVLAGIMMLFIDAEFAQIVLALLFALFARLDVWAGGAAKKKLVMTERAKRIYMTAGLLLIAPTAIALIFSGLPFLWVLPIQAIPFCLMMATWILDPNEQKINASFRADAVKKFASINPTVIGITGSYGKTSVKHLLGHVLEFHAPTLFTPGSVNTEMGIVRVIREQLQPHHKFFIVEMGAYGIGSIAKLCALTPPHIAAITAIGHAHFERFKTIEDTARAKFEIAEAAAKQIGKVVITTNVMEREAAKTFQKNNPSALIICGEGGDITLRDVNQTKAGIDMTITYKGDDYAIETPLFGLHQAENILVTFALAVQLGMAPETVVMALRSAPQTKHRLEVKNLDVYTLIDDAYNSNPKGFASALDILDLLGRGSRRILITPGMVELGDAHDAEHQRVGELAAAKADIVIAVCPERIQAFCKGFESKKSPQQILVRVPTFAAAQNWVQQHSKKDDVILLENDLPDLYEKAFIC